MLETRNELELQCRLHILDHKIQRRIVKRSKIDREIAELEKQFDTTSRILYNKRERGKIYA